MVEEPLTCTLQEAADLIGVSRSTVDRLLEAGLIYERKVHGIRRRLISRASVVAFVDGPTNAAGSAPGLRPGQLASLPAPAGGALADLEDTTARGRNPRAAATAD